MTQGLEHPKRGKHMNGNNGDNLSTVPVLDRLQYFYGQLLGARDLQVEQSYFREKLKLHNRRLHGYGVVCGLLVEAVPLPAECPPSDTADTVSDEDRQEIERRIRELDRRLRQMADKDSQQYKDLSAEMRELQRKLAGGTGGPALLVVQPGLALDCEGNELVVREPLCFNPWKLLEPSERRRLEDGGETLYVSLCFHEQPVEPTRPALTDPCGAVGACTFGKLRDSVRVHVSLDEPSEDLRCDSCCEACAECCLLLASVADFSKDAPVEDADIDNSVRREIGAYVPAAVAGVSWSHGGTYTAEQAAEILGADGGEGLEIRFTRPIHANGLRDPVLQVYVTERGRGRAAGVYELQGTFGGTGGATWVDRLRYRQTTDESLQRGDLVMITLRAPMLLDRCCRPLDGLHVGGRVPLLPEYERFRAADVPTFCDQPPFKAGPWTTHGAGNFESWFCIQPKDDSAKEESR
jgi:hypothetical protein